jgi:hypothetical protein
MAGLSGTIESLRKALDSLLAFVTKLSEHDESPLFDTLLSTDLLRDSLLDRGRTLQAARLLLDLPSHGSEDDIKSDLNSLSPPEHLQWLGAYVGELSKLAYAHPPKLSNYNTSQHLLTHVEVAAQTLRSDDTEARPSRRSRRKKR